MHIHITQTYTLKVRNAGVFLTLYFQCWKMIHLIKNTGHFRVWSYHLTNDQGTAQIQWDEWNIVWCSFLSKLNVVLVVCFIESVTTNTSEKYSTSMCNKCMYCEVLCEHRGCSVNLCMNKPWCHYFTLTTCWIVLQGVDGSLGSLANEILLLYLYILHA